MRAQFLLTDIPRDLRDALAERARAEETSATNLASQILAARYRLPFEPSKLPLSSRFQADEYVRPNGQALGHTMNLKLPLAVVEAVRREAGPKTQRRIVLEALAAALDVQLPKPRNRGHGRPRGRKVSA